MLSRVHSGEILHIFEALQRMEKERERVESGMEDERKEVRKRKEISFPPPFRKFNSWLARTMTFKTRTR